MNKLKAFIGHSFTSGDQTVIQTFLKFFDQVKGMNIGFTWQHAEAAEPQDLARKVLRLIEDKNLFIGICTKKEIVTAQENVKKGLLYKDILTDYSWKTSDWIIQEIGLAKGRGMELILLLEDGLRPPGGLQGDLEYITFDRFSPEKSYGKILEMIRALMPKATALTGEETNLRTTTEPKPKPEEEKTEWYKPETDWSRRKYEITLLRAILTNNEEQAQQIYQAYLNTDDANSPENRDSWEAFHEFAKFKFGEGGNFTRLHEIAVEHPENSKVQGYLARGYQVYAEHENAALCFKAAAEIAEDKKTTLDYYRDTAVSFSRAGQEQNASSILEIMRDLAQFVDDGESILLRTIVQIAEGEEDKDRFWGLTERLLQLHPEDTDTRFQLAYDYSEAGRHELAIFHYLKIPSQARSATTWNNLGVEFDNFALQFKSVAAYRRSEELGETLAMSNLAQKLIGAGFLKEAEEICNRAVKIDNFHKNIGSNISRIKDIPEAEDKKETEIMTNIIPVSEFYREYGQSFIKNDLQELDGIWDGNRCPLNIEIRNGKFRAEGTYEQRSPGGLLNALSGLDLKQPEKPMRFVVRYEGIINGYTVKGFVSITSEGENVRLGTLLTDGEKSKPVLMVIDQEQKTIKVYEKDATTTDLFYNLVRHNG